MTLMTMLRFMVRDARRRLILEAATCRGEAIQIDHECGGTETVLSALLRYRAAWCDLGAVLLGERIER